MSEDNQEDKNLGSIENIEQDEGEVPTISR